MQIFQNPLYISLLLYIIIMILVFYSKPRIFFDKNGKIKSTGCGTGKVIFSFPMFIVISSILIYFFIKIIKTKLKS